MVAGLALALSLVSPGQAETDDVSAHEAHRADAEKTFKEKVGPFVNKYCVTCHGPRAEAGINLRSALRNPGAASSFLHWKKAVANVKVHDMPPDHADKTPSDEERRQFIEWIGKLKYLAQRDPGLFVIRRLSKVEYGNTLHDLYGVEPLIARQPARGSRRGGLSQLDLPAAVGAVPRYRQQGRRSGRVTG